MTSIATSSGAPYKVGESSRINLAAAATAAWHWRVALKALQKTAYFLQVVSALAQQAENDLDIETALGRSHEGGVMRPANVRPLAARVYVAVASPSKLE